MIGFQGDALELLAVIAIVAVIIYFMFGFGAKAGPMMTKDKVKGGVDRLLVAQAHDRNNLLNTWRREIANLIVWHDPDRYVDLYKTLHAEVSGYKDWKLEALQTKYDEISGRYPNYSDFDPFGTRLHVLYADARSWDSEELEQLFADITRFQAILCASNRRWDWFDATSNGDLEHLATYVRRIKDTKFQLRLERAIADYYVWFSCKEETTDDLMEVMRATFDYGNVNVQHIQHFAENRYGIHFKDTNEYGLYCFSTFDDGRTSYRHYRTDSAFGNEQCLDVLHGVLADLRQRLGQPSRAG